MSYGFEIIDAHAHIYPKKIAGKAVESIFKFYNIPMVGGSGTSEELIERGSKAGISKFLVHSTATSPEQVRAINNYILGECLSHPGLFVGFGTLHPDMTAPHEEIDYMVHNGLRGIKLHPDFQRFAIDSQVADKLYDAASGRLPILFHAGDKRYQFSNPARIAAVALRWPNLTIIAAHFGGYSEWDAAAELLCDLKNVYFDTSSSLYFIGAEKAAKMIRKAGADRFLFGSDYPMWDYPGEIERFMAIPLTDDERKMIFSDNFKRLIGV